MEKREFDARKSKDLPVTSSLKNLSLHSTPGPPRRLHFLKMEPRKLVSLCLGVLGQYLEDIVEDLAEISLILPTHIKMVLAAVARRKQLLDDNVLIALIDSSWEFLDVSGSSVSDTGLIKAASMCTNLKAIDISQCDKITVVGISGLLHQCHALETLRCGGSPSSESTACQCLDLLKPKLEVIDGESWEELDSMDISSSAQSLRWLVWPKIDDHLKHSLAVECPRVRVNPQPSPLGIVQIPRAALPRTVLDEPVLEDIDPRTWAVAVCPPTPSNTSALVSDTRPEIPIAEKFRLAFIERDNRLAPKRAKNARQHRRRAEEEWLSSSADAKSLALASQADKLRRGRN